MRSKVEAARMATRFGAYTVIAAGRTPNVIQQIADGGQVGTRFEPTTGRVEGWKRYLLTGKASSKGGVVIDAGAAKAVRLLVLMHQPLITRTSNYWAVFCLNVARLYQAVSPPFPTRNSVVWRLQSSVHVTSL